MPENWPVAGLKDNHAGNGPPPPSVAESVSEALSRSVKLPVGTRKLTEVSSAKLWSASGLATTGASLTGVIVTGIVTVVMPPAPSETCTVKLSLPLALAFGV